MIFTPSEEVGVETPRKPTQGLSICHTSATHTEIAARVLEAAWENSFKKCNAPQREDRFRQRVTAGGAEARKGPTRSPRRRSPPVRIPTDPIKPAWQAVSANQGAGPTLRPDKRDLHLAAISFTVAAPPTFRDSRTYNGGEGLVAKRSGDCKCSRRSSSPSPYLSG